MTPPLVAVDAMGGDHAPVAVVEGARRAVAAGHRVVLVGDPGRLGDTGELEVVAASEVIEMHDDPGRSVRRKKDASMVRAAELVRDGRADAFVGLGNTGATMAAALLRIGRISGVKRPAIAAVVPAPGTTHRTVMLDVGANAECSAPMLEQFARMGAAFCRIRVGTPVPRVALLSIGEEDGKGDSLVRAAGDLLADPDFGPRSGAEFVGNVEGGDIIAGTVDVVVCDGFTGNVALKSIEGTSAWVSGVVRERLGARADAPDLVDLWPQLDPDRHNGAILLGLRAVTVIGHGSSSPEAAAAAIALAAELAEHHVAASIEEAMAR